jgi:hypothetical protein
MLTERRMLTISALLLTSCTRHYGFPSDASWDEKSAAFGWVSGGVRLPIGFKYQVEPGDTFTGHFTSRDGKVVIQHDIGGYAGVWAERKKSTSFEEKVVEGSRVWIAHRNWPDGKGGNTTLVAVTFPDSGLANFYVESPNREGVEVINFIALSFHPKGRIEHPYRPF